MIRAKKLDKTGVGLVLCFSLSKALHNSKIPSKTSRGQIRMSKGLTFQENNIVEPHQTLGQHGRHPPIIGWLNRVAMERDRETISVRESNAISRFFRTQGIMSLARQDLKDEKAECQRLSVSGPDPSCLEVLLPAMQTRLERFRTWSGAARIIPTQALPMSNQGSSLSQPCIRKCNQFLCKQYHLIVNISTGKGKGSSCNRCNQDVSL